MRKIFPESDYKKLSKLGAKLGIPIPQVHIALKVEKDGNILSSFQDRSRTWNRNFWNYLIGAMAYCPHSGATFASGYLTSKSTAGSTNANVAANHYGNMSGPISNSNYGILTGTGTAAESFEGFALSTPIVHGSGTGQLVHQAQSTPTATWTVGTLTWLISQYRIFNNNSNGSITVAEIAIVHYNTGGQYVMINRDLLSVAQVVPNGAQLTVTYDISLVFPQ